MQNSSAKPGHLKRLTSRFTRLHSDFTAAFLPARFRVAVFLLWGKAAGAHKDPAVADRDGVSDVVDAYQFTMTLANWLPITIVGALSVVLIPVLVNSRDEEDSLRKRFLSELHGWVILLGVLLAVGIYIGWPWVLEWAGAGLDAETRRMSAQLTWAFAPAALLTLLTGISAARLRARERYINTLLDSVPAVVILICVLLATTGADVGPLLWGTLLGYVLQSAWLYWLAEKADGSSGRPRLSFSTHQWPDLMKAAGVMLVGQVAMSFVGPIDQYTAANLDGNANATLGYATRLLSLLLGLGAASVGRAALPVLADVQRRGDADRARKLALKWSVLMAAAGAGVTAIGWLLAPWMVALIFERGAFTLADTLRVAEVMRWGLLQMPFYFGVLILVQLLASQNSYRIMAGIAVANFLLKAIMNATLAPIMGASGIMLATSLMYALSYVWYVAVALRRPPELQVKS